MPLPVNWIAREEARLIPRFDPKGYWWWDNMELLASRPQIMTLCGSTRFVEEFNHFRQYFTLKGKIVLSIEIVTTQMREEDPQHVNRSNKEMLDALHLHKINISDVVFVINKGGYIGDSTRNEIAHALRIGVPVQYMMESLP